MSQGHGCNSIDFLRLYRKVIVKTKLYMTRGLCYLEILQIPHCFATVVYLERGRKQLAF